MTGVSRHRSGTWRPRPVPIASASWVTARRNVRASAPPRRRSGTPPHKPPKPGRLQRAWRRSWPPPPTKGASKGIGRTPGAPGPLPTKGPESSYDRTATSLGDASLGDAKRDHDRRRRGRGQAAALRWAAADQVARCAARDGTPKGLRDAALVAVASDLCARVSEVAALRVRDVTTAGDGSAAVDVWSVKTGTARTGYLRASTVRRVRAWTDAAGIGNGSPLFPSMDRWGRVKQPLRAMQPRAVADAIRSRAAAAGIDRASGHSLRVGAAVSMAQRGASLVAMQQAGGWRSPDMPAHYARQAAASRGAVATLRPEDRWA